MKYDDGKPRYELLPAGAIDNLAKVLTFGADKYAANSWRGLENGLERYRLLYFVTHSLYKRVNSWTLNQVYHIQHMLCVVQRSLTSWSVH